MFHLVLAACLTADPAICGQRLLPAADASDLHVCQQKSAAIARDWIVRHPELSAGSTSCVDTAALPTLTVTQAAPGIYLHQGAMAQLSPDSQGRIANLGFIIGDTVAVIDAGGSRAEGEALYAAIRRVTDKPISHLILTHMHPDHILGAEVFSEAGASIVADARLPEAVARRASAWMQSIPAQIGEAAFAGSRFVAVDRTISGPTVIALGNTDLTVSPQPSAHTDNDMTVWDSRSATLFTGDLLFRGLTPSLGGSLTGWIGWTDTTPAPLPALIVPGHGPTSHDWADATAAQRQYLEALRDTTRKTLRAGMALSQAIPAIVRMMQPYSEGWADFDGVTARNAATAYSQLEWD